MKVRKGKPCKRCGWSTGGWHSKDECIRMLRASVDAERQTISEMRASWRGESRLVRALLVEAIEVLDGTRESEQEG